MHCNRGLVSIALLVAIAGCKVGEESAKGEGGGGAGATGAGGEAAGGAATGGAATGGAATGGGATGGAGQAGGQVADECQGIPVEGECIGTTGIRSCFVSEEPGVAPQIIEIDCGADEVCELVAGAAVCNPVGDCYEGDSRCIDSSTLEECVGGAWVQSTCGGVDSCIAQPGVGAMCAFQDSGSGIKLRGHLEYEFKKPNAGLTDFTAENYTEGAVDFFVTAYNGAGELIGLGLTSPGDGVLAAGDWELTLDEAPDDQTFVYFWPMLFDNNGNPRMAVAHAQTDDPSAQTSDLYWSWGFEVCPAGTGACGVTDLGNQLIDELSGSGAAHIYQWIDYGIFRFADLIPDVTPLTVGIFWEPGVQFTCGSCFLPPQMGGSNIVYDPANNGVDHFDSSLAISGSLASPHHWSRTTINHEFGHWAMQSYSKSPGEGGPHYVDEASKPGLAYSEGFATFCGQTNISNGPADNDPIAFRKSQGSAFWVDMSSISWSDGVLVLPDENGPIDQYINENVVSIMMWNLWAESGAIAPQGLGDGPLFSVLPADRLVGDVNRGYFKVDFVDYLDALSCAAAVPQPTIQGAIFDLRYPYDHAPVCQ